MHTVADQSHLDLPSPYLHDRVCGAGRARSVFEDDEVVAAGTERRINEKDVYILVRNAPAKSCLGAHGGDGKHESAAS